MTTQRKIGHVLKSYGTGADFTYHRELATPFDLSKPILVTEKVDGSTMQALRGMPFKRYDKFKAGDPRKHSASEEERYRLEQCSRDKPHEQYYLDAFDLFADGFAAAASHVWIYFEAIGPKIGARYRGEGEGPTIRVFDTAADGAFLPFGETRAIAARAGLPTVANIERTFGNLDGLLTVLAAAESGDPGLPKHVLEGWVLRQWDGEKELVAKIRKGDLGRLAV